MVQNENLIVFQQMETQLLQSEHPSTYFNSLLGQPWFQEEPFKNLYQLSKTEQSPIHHPEGDVWTHTMLVVNEAAKNRDKSSNPRVFMWAALLHDIGKGKTTKYRKGHITSYDHDKVGEDLTKEFLSQFTKDQEFIKQVCGLVRWHMMILYVTKNLKFGNKEKMLAETNLVDLGLLGWCDRLGRLGVDHEKEKTAIKLFYERSML